MRNQMSRRTNEFVEEAFRKALERLVRRRMKEGNQFKINMTTLAAEAGYARSYLYKFPIPSVIARLREIEGRGGPSKEAMPRDVLGKLRMECDRLREERDLALETSRRLMLELIEAKGPR